MSEANKDDTGKLRWDLLPPDAVEDVVKILTDGAEQYGNYNWARGMSWSRCFSAMMRHAWAYWRGEDNDPDSGMHHMGHVAVNALFLLAYAKRSAGCDDRFKIETKETKCPEEKLCQCQEPKEKPKWMLESGLLKAKWDQEEGLLQTSEFACASPCSTEGSSSSRRTRRTGTNPAGPSKG